MKGTEIFTPEGYRVGSAENREYVSSVAGLLRAAETGAICEATVVLCDSEDYSLRVELGGAIGIIRREEICLTSPGEEVKSIAAVTRVSRTVAFVVQHVDMTASPPVAYLSRREAQRRCMREYVSGLIPGDIIPAKVTHLERFGAFVDIGCGIVSLLPVDAISVSRISHPRERLPVSSRIHVVVRGFDALGRVNVSHRELCGTWEENAAMFSPGQTVAGIVRSVESYGIFVELTPNLTGLAEPHDGVTVGGSAAVYIKSIAPERMKVKLAVIGAYQGELLREVSPPRYFIDTESVTHIDAWRYSPPSCPRVIETVF